MEQGLSVVLLLVLLLVLVLCDRSLRAAQFCDIC